MKTKYNKNNIKIVLFFWVSCVLFVSCEKYEEEVPRRTNVTSSLEYVIPVGVPLSDEERKIVDARNKEYREAVPLGN